MFHATKACFLVFVLALILSACAPAQPDFHPANARPAHWYPTDVHTASSHPASTGSARFA